MNQQNLEKETTEGVEKKDLAIDLRGLFGILLYRGWIILLCVICACVISFLISYFQTAEYASEATLYLTGIPVDGDGVAESNAQSIALGNAKDGEKLIKGRGLLAEASARLAAQDTPILNPATGAAYTIVQLMAMTTVTNPTNTRILTIRVTATDKALSMHIANMIATVASEMLTEKLGYKAVVWDDAGNGSATNDNMIRNLLIAAVLGVIVAVAGILIAFFADDKVKVPEDIERHLHISVLGQIPITPKLTDTLGNARKNGKRGKRA